MNQVVYSLEEPLLALSSAPLHYMAGHGA